MLKEVPNFMCTQHPDSTVKITAQEEVDEAIQGYAMYGCDEVMVDYEGKLTPYAQPKDIVVRSHKLGIPIGVEYFITPRIPNPRLEDFDRMALSLEAALIANYYSYTLAGSQAVKWIILPMVEEPETLRLLQRLLIRKSTILQEELKIPVMPIQLVPLIEETERFVKVHEFIISLNNVLKEFSVHLKDMRVFLGKSDAAVKSGHIASALGMLYALTVLRELDKELEIDIKPIIGMGMPPFRGGINNPKIVNFEVEHYRGYNTVTIQSAVRYDVPFNEYRKVYTTLRQGLGAEPRKVSPEILQLIGKAASKYRATVSRYLEVLNKYSIHVPSTRDRVAWREYGRTIVIEDRILNVPRAIVYTSTWYLLGVPPLLLDADFIVEVYKGGELCEVLKYLPHLMEEWRYEMSFYVPEVAAKRLGDHIVNKVNEALDIMGMKPEPNETYKSILELNPVEAHVIALGKIRGFLG